MIKLDYDGDIPGYRVHSMAPSDPMERKRYLGTVQITTDGFHAKAGIASREHATVLAYGRSLPAAIQALIDLHTMTDYQYAPWPSMDEEDEE